MVPYEELSETAKDLDRVTVREVYKAIVTTYLESEFKEEEIDESSETP
jgi:hypothetical protein